MIASILSRSFAACAVGSLCLFAVTATAQDALPGKYPTLTASTPAELPPTAAGIIRDAKARDRVAVTTDVVKQSLAINPAAAPVIVGAIARAVPDMAATAAAVAAAEQPAQAELISRAAAAAAPSKAGKIVAAVCTAVPNQYRTVAVAAAEAAPTASKDILRSVGLSVPALKPYIDKEIAGYGASIPSVPKTLDQVGVTWAKANPGMVAGGPVNPPADGGVHNPPPVHHPGTPGNSPPPMGGGTPGAGRNYARP